MNNASRAIASQDPVAAAVGELLDLQSLLEKATALVHRGAIEEAREAVALAWKLHRDVRLPSILAGLDRALAERRRRAAPCFLAFGLQELTSLAGETWLLPLPGILACA